LLKFAHFCGYSAVIAIYVFIIKQPSNSKKIEKCLRSAERCQEQIRLSGEVESFARRCTGVLEELHAEVVAKLDGSLGNAVPEITGRDVQPPPPQQEQEQAVWHEGANNISVVDRIDRWGFWGLTGY
jgi:galactonate dehydratase